MLSTPITYALRIFTKLYPVQKPLVFSGEGSIQKLADLMISSGHKKPLIITGRFLLENDRLDTFLDHLDANGCELSIYSGVNPNPTFAEVEAALKLSKYNACDSVFAIGGGSIIDVAKVVAAASTNNKSLDKLTGLLKVKKAPLAFYAVPTTSGSGSEVTNAAVISDSETHKKKFFVDPKYVPIATALDPDLLMSLPPHMTAAVGMDALTHAIEAYTSHNNSIESDRDARVAIKLLLDYLPIAYAEGDNLKAREMVALASFLAGYAFTRSSLGYVHAISHQVSAHYDTPHGLANAILLPRVLQFNKSSSAKRFAELEMMLSGENVDVDIDTLADRFNARVTQIGEQLNIPSKLSDLKQTDFNKITKDALAEARTSYAVPKVMRHKDVEVILNSVSSGQLDLSFS